MQDELSLALQILKSDYESERDEHALKYVFYHVQVVLNGEFKIDHTGDSNLTRIMARNRTNMVKYASNCIR